LNCSYCGRADGAYVDVSSPSIFSVFVLQPQHEHMKGEVAQQQHHLQKNSTNCKRNSKLKRNVLFSTLNNKEKFF
jgi:hypothetical protein